MPAALAALVIGLTLAAASTPASAALLAYYDFENTFANSAPGGAATPATTPGNDPTFTTVQSMIGTGLAFDETQSQYFQVPFGNTNLGNNFTISAWYWQATLPTDRDFVFESSGTGNFDVSYGTGAANSSFSSFLANVSKNTNVTAAGQWHHALHAISSNGTASTLRVYIDGVAQTVGTTEPTANMVFPAINFGTFRDATGRFWDGYMDEVALWNHAMSAASATNLYNQTLGGRALTQVDPGVLAARIGVTGTTNPGTVYTVPNQAVGFGGISFENANLGDHELYVAPGQIRLQQADGVIIANPNQQGKFFMGVSGDLTETSSDARYNNGMGFISMNSGGEGNFDFSFASFRFSDGWIGGHVNDLGSRVGGVLVAPPATAQFFTTNTNTLPAGSTVTELGNGQFALRLAGVDARTDGMLFVMSARNGAEVSLTGQNNLAFAAPYRDASNVNIGAGAALGDWHVTVRDQSANTGESGNWSFVYVPYTLMPDGSKQISGLIGGEILDQGDSFNAVKGNHVGNFTVADTGVGLYSIQIAKTGGGFYSDQDGILILSSSSILEASVGDLLDTNYMNWIYDAGTQSFIIQSYDLPTANGLQDFDGTGGFYFAFIPYVSPPTLIDAVAAVPAPAALPAGLAMAGLLMVRRRRRGR